ncbi:unnamed protein product, partial [Ascophyllum nodosum]
GDSGGGSSSGGRGVSVDSLQILCRYLSICRAITFRTVVEARTSGLDTRKNTNMRRARYETRLP